MRIQLKYKEVKMKEKNFKGCDCWCKHEDVVNGVRQRLPEAKSLEQMTEIYRILGDRTRLNILAALNCHEMCVGDLAVLLDMSKSAVSHQLRVLRENKLVTNERNGKNIYYYLADNHVKDMLDVALEHVCEKGCNHNEKVHHHEMKGD